MDLYNRERRLSSIENAIRKTNLISEQDKELIFKFETYLFSQSLDPLTVEKKLRVLKIAAELLQTPFMKVDREQLTFFFARISRQDRSSWNKRDYYLTVKKFYRWLGKPELVEGFQNPRGRSRLPALLTQTEVDMIIRRTPHLRDKAMISVLYDLGCRCGEFASMKIGDFIFEDHITNHPIEVSKGLYRFGRVMEKKAHVSLFGKTGARLVELDRSTPFVWDWIEKHPRKCTPKSSMWVSDEGDPLFRSYDDVIQHLQSISGRAGITKKINFRPFRHGRMTELARTLIDTYMKERHGTTQLDTYIHL